MAAHDSQLLRGALALVLLRLLAARESYGYELVKRVHAAGLDGVAAGSVYPALARLEREGCVITRLVASADGPARKYYRLTEEGRAVMERVASAWRHLAGVIEPLLAEAAPPEPEEVGS